MWPWRRRWVPQQVTGGSRRSRRRRGAPDGRTSTAALRHQQGSAFAELGLTPAAARALHELDPDHPLPARDLAGRLGCDRSNVTVLVDKLEQAGLVERRTDPADRRQKTLVVTEARPRRAGPGDRGDVRLPTPRPG